MTEPDEKEWAAPQEAAQVFQPKEVTQKEESDRYYNTTTQAESIAESVLDRVITMTKFPTMGAKRKYQVQVTLRQFGSHLPSIIAASKDRLPWYKMAAFGDQRTDKGALRSNKNMNAADGAEIDYDGGAISLNKAAGLLQNHNVGGLLYSTPSATADCHKWRIFAPFSRTLDPKERARHVARLNGILGGEIDGASFTMSQAFYAGNIEGRAPIDIALIEGRAIDLCDDLDAGALDKKRKPWRAEIRHPKRPANPLPPSQQGTREGLDYLNNACQRLADAKPGEQDFALRDACWLAGRLVAEGRVNKTLAISALSIAAAMMSNEVGREPWQVSEIARKISKAMEAAR